MTANGLACRVVYTNHRGETAERLITPISIRWGASRWHSRPQWLLSVYDHGKAVEREFALKDCDFTATAQEGEPHV
jgi:hypothetical protein